MTDEVMTIREMCDVFDVTPRTLRFYEAKELIFPIREGQKRLFTRSDRARLKLILRGKRFGFSLEEIRQALDLYNTDDSGLAQLNNILIAYKSRKSALEEQERELSQIKKELEEQIDWVQGQLEMPEQTGKVA